MGQRPPQRKLMVVRCHPHELVVARATPAMGVADEPPPIIFFFFFFLFF